MTRVGVRPTCIYVCVCLFLSECMCVFMILFLQERVGGWVGIEFECLCCNLLLALLVAYFVIDTQGYNIFLCVKGCLKFISSCCTFAVRYYQSYCYCYCYCYCCYWCWSWCRRSWNCVWGCGCGGLVVVLLIYGTGTSSPWTSFECEVVFVVFLFYNIPLDRKKRLDSFSLFVSFFSFLFQFWFSLSFLCSQLLHRESFHFTERLVEFSFFLSTYSFSSKKKIKAQNFWLSSKPKWNEIKTKREKEKTHSQIRERWTEIEWKI